MSDRRDYLYRLIKQNLRDATDTKKLKWIMSGMDWETAEDVRDTATDDQVEAFLTVWGADAYVP